LIADEPCYDLGELAGANWHVHGFYSGCEEMTLPNLVADAEAAGLHTLAVTDHHGVAAEPEDIDGFVSALREEFKGIETNVRFLFGGELSSIAPGVFIDSLETNARMDYRLYATTHYHLGLWGQPEDRSPRGYAKHALATVRALIPTGRADCIAHPFQMDTKASAAVTDRELAEVLELGKKHGVAWGINTQWVCSDPDFSRRLWGMGREIGVTFRMGTDAHERRHIDPKPFLPALHALFDDA